MANVAEVRTGGPQTKNRTQLEDEVEAIPSTRRSFHQNPRLRGIALVTVLLLVVVAVGLWLGFAGRESTDDAQIDGHIVPVSAKVGGTVLKVEIEENQFVNAGAALVQIDPQDYSLAVAAAQADLANAEASAQAARTSVPIVSTTTTSDLTAAVARAQSAHAGIAASQKEGGAAEARQRAAQAHLDELQAKEARAARDLDRMKQLASKDEISQQQYDASLSAAEEAKAAAASARADLVAADQAVLVARTRVEQAQATLAEAQAEIRTASTAPQHVAVTQAQAKSAEARVQQARAALDQAQLNRRYATIRAPQSGVISKKAVEVGQIVQPGQPLLAIVPLEGIWVTANFKETQLKNMRVGQSAIISVDAYGSRKYRGHVQSFSAATGEKFSLLPPENATGNYVKVVQRVPVRIDFEIGQDPEHLLRPGMSVEPTVTTK